MIKVLLAVLATTLGMPAPTSAQVFRCGSKYQSSPCANGREVNVSAPLSSDTPSSELVYLCKQHNGQLFWIDKPCYHYQKAMLEREVRVPYGLTWEERVAYAQREKYAADTLQIAPAHPVFRHAGKTAPNCDGYRQALESNASAARAGGTARYMEGLAEQRRAISKQMHAAGC
ncbi:hypothetical protein [Ottowia thiooxydans]|uniref:hypothetical protein n=1 Tax=Ottowia thiooxydans TaxID=219182 RepID=UPI00048D33E8|nr:hypothetical protein [Ottowia thiooxydans]